MYRAPGGAVVASASDLVAFLYCRHKTALDLQVADGVREQPEGEDDETAVLQRRGLDHEAAYLASLRAQGLAVDDIGAPSAPDAPGGDGAQRLDALRARVAATERALAAGTDIVFQATFLDDRDPDVWWRGHADFLRRVHDRHPDTGRPAYEPEDTKLARRIRPSAVVQLSLYADLLSQLQGVAPDMLHVVLGGSDVESVPYAHVGSYERLARQRLVGELTGQRAATYPELVGHCSVCRWSAQCEQQRVDDDHLSLVAGLGREQARKLRAVGITTVAELAAVAAMDPDDRPVPPRLGRATYERVVHQARLQVAGREHPDAPPPFELLDPSGPERGLEALPPPSTGDLYFDIEGDPFVGDGGLEYLFGIGWVEDGEFAFRAFWGHDEHEEKRAFEQLVDFIGERRAQHPDLHVYHYAPYERTALGKLMGRHGTREDEVDDLFRQKVLVDLYRVVRQGLRVGAESYSIKKLEPLYMEARADEITDAASSIVEYERWLETGDQTILAAIEDYNRTDCESTWLLHRWLEDRRGDAVATFGALDRPGPPGRTVTDAEQTERSTSELNERMEALSDRLLAATGEQSGPDDDPDDHALWLLSQLLHFHRREDKPAWWRYFERVLDYEPGSMVDDPDCLGELTYEGEVGTVARSILHRYRFDPDQEHKIREGTKLYDPATRRVLEETGEKASTVGTIHEIDVVEGTLTLKRGKTNAAPHPRDLIPNEIVGCDPLKEALVAIAESVEAHGIAGSGPYRAARDLLARRPPRVAGTPDGQPLRRTGESITDAVSRVLLGLDHTYLPIQGPPGTGKTHNAAHAIVDLVQAGKRVGITANSHAVVGNLLEKVMDVARERSVRVRAMQKVKGSDEGVKRDDVEVKKENEPVEQAVAAGEVDVVAGTAWLFSREALDSAFDYVVVDEAGQLSLANVVAVGRAARNLVLVGDPQQLAQPTTGTHPPGVGISGLEHVLAGHATVPEHLGLFLDETRRMHPSITAYISELAYEGRLETHAACAQQEIGSDGRLSGSGLRWVPVEHEGNSTSSEEEAAVLDGLYRDLLGKTWTNQHGERCTLGPEDLLVVAPYNAQVHLLAQQLPDGAKVGTIDRFQGQGAAAVLVSLAASDVDQIPRGMEFLYSMNRLNVAVSRARALAAVIASPALLAAPVRTVGQLRLVNGLCRFAELGHQ